MDRSKPGIREFAYFWEERDFLFDGAGQSIPAFLPERDESGAYRGVKSPGFLGSPSLWLTCASAESPDRTAFWFSYDQGTDEAGVSLGNETLQGKLQCQVQASHSLGVGDQPGVVLTERSETKVNLPSVSAGSQASSTLIKSESAANPIRWFNYLTLNCAVGE
jgi:hypothetical protein